MQVWTDVEVRGKFIHLVDDQSTIRRNRKDAHIFNTTPVTTLRSSISSVGPGFLSFLRLRLYLVSGTYTDLCCRSVPNVDPSEPTYHKVEKTFPSSTIQLCSSGAQCSHLTRRNSRLRSDATLAHGPIECFETAEACCRDVTIETGRPYSTLGSRSLGTEASGALALSSPGVPSCRGGAWKAQGLLAGEWRDKKGRLRRASPSDVHSSPACTSSVRTSSYAPSEVSFDGLVQELRDRLPPPFPKTKLETTTYKARLCDEEAKARCSRDVIGEKEKSPGASGAGCSVSCSCEQHIKPEKREGKTLSPFPVGCLQLSAQIGRGTIPTRIRLTAHRTKGAMPWDDAAARVREDDPCAHNSTRGEMAATAIRSSCSPSAAMVAASKAQERALPLLQVYAEQVPAP